MSATPALADFATVPYVLWYLDICRCLNNGIILYGYAMSRHFTCDWPQCLDYWAESKCQRWVLVLLNVNSLTDGNQPVRCYYDTLWSNGRTTCYSLKYKILQFPIETRKMIWIVLNVKKMQQQHWTSGVPRLIFPIQHGDTNIGLRGLMR